MSNVGTLLHKQESVSLRDAPRVELMLTVSGNIYLFHEPPEVTFRPCKNAPADKQEMFPSAFLLHYQQKEIHGRGDGVRSRSPRPPSLPPKRRPSHDHPVLPDDVRSNFATTAQAIKPPPVQSTRATPRSCIQHTRVVLFCPLRLGAARIESVTCKPSEKVAVSTNLVSCLDKQRQAGAVTCPKTLRWLDRAGGA